MRRLLKPLLEDLANASLVISTASHGRLAASASSGAAMQSPSFRNKGTLTTLHGLLVEEGALQASDCKATWHKAVAIFWSNAAMQCNMPMNENEIWNVATVAASDGMHASVCNAACSRRLRRCWPAMRTTWPGTCASSCASEPVANSPFHCC